MLLAGDELKTIAGQPGHSSIMLTADACLSVAVELGLKSAAAAARLMLKAGKPPQDREPLSADLGPGQDLSQSGSTFGAILRASSREGS